LSQAINHALIGLQRFVSELMHQISSLLDCLALQPSLQYLTSTHTFSHFLRQAKGLPQVAQIFCGKFDFFTIFPFDFINKCLT